MSKDKVSKFVSASVNKVTAKIQSYDAFGSPVGFNFNGKGGVTTFPGGVLGLALKVLIWSFTINSIDAMFEMTNWSLIG